MLASGEQAIAPVESGVVGRIAAIDATTPKLDQPKKATLNVELATLRTPPAQPLGLLVLPARRSGRSGNVLVATSLDAATIEKLVDGQRVVLLGSKPFPARATSFQMDRPTGDIQGNLATVIARHPLTDQFPNDGYCDWQFSKMLAGGSAVNLDAVPEAFDPLLEVVSSYKTISQTGGRL